MDKKQLLESIQKIDEMIETQTKIKTQLQEVILKDTFDKLNMWKNKQNDSITAYVVGMNIPRKEITVNTTNFKEVVFGYSEFFDYYIPVNM